MRNTVLMTIAAGMLAAAPAVAQTQAQPQAMGTATSSAPVDTAYGQPAQVDDDGFPWGLLGLLGLLGLIPRRKRNDATADNRS